LDDALLAGRAAAGDLDSFGQLYDRYFIRVYDFSWRTLSDTADAVAATEEAFTRTARALASPGGAPSFRALLFAAAHRAALARADAPPDPRATPAHEEAFGAFGVPDPAHVDQASAVRGDHELAVLAWESLAALTARDYALLDLHLRQGLSADEIAHVLSATRKDAKTILARMTRSANDVIEQYVIARRGACPALRDALSSFPIPPFDDAAAAAAQAHIALCAACQQDRRQLPPLLEVLTSFTPISASLALKGDLWRSIAGGWRIAPASVEAGLFEEERFDETAKSPYKPLSDVATGGAPPFYPRPRSQADGSGEWSGNKVLVFAIAAVGLLVFAFAGGAAITGAFGGGGDGDDDAVAADRTRDSSPGIDVTSTANAPGVVVETPTEDPSRSPTSTPTEEVTRTPAPAATATPPPPPPPTATAPPAPSPTPAPGGPSPTPTRRAFIPIGTPTPAP
jgi:DNA-directed RNA polymerase specialized sigma24 family protein